MKPILLQIRRKTLVPTKRNIVHQYRSDWKGVGKISYDDSKKLFKVISGGPISTDAHFAKLLFDNFGEGIYSIIAFQKGRQGFWSFIMLELQNNGFRRIQKNKTIEQRENEKIHFQINRLQKQLETSNVLEKIDLQKEIDDLKEEMGDNKELINIDREISKSGPYPYLIQTRPLLKFHSYITINMNIEEKEVQNVGTPQLW